MMKSNLFWLLTAVWLTATTPTHAQQPAKIPRIGYLDAGSASNRQGFDALRLRLREPAFHDPVRLMLGDKRLLRASAQPVGGWPVGMRLQKGREALEAGFMRMQLEPDPARGRVGKIGL